MDISTLSEYVINQFSTQSPDGITPMKLQKLLFYVKAWTLVAGNQLVFADFEHWDYGPVNRDVYKFYRQYGSNPIDAKQLDEPDISQSNKELIDFIIENYISFDAFTLSAMTHTEQPWKKTNRNEVILDELIKSYYSEQRFAKNFQCALDLKNNPFYPLEDYSFEMDMSEKDAEEISQYPSYKDYKKILEQAKDDFETQLSSFVLN